jgi:hypothetical protein
MTGLSFNDPAAVGAAQNQTSCVIDTRECHNWSAIILVVAPASSSTVAVVLRQASKVAQELKPCRSRVWANHRVTLRGSRNVPSIDPKMGSSGPTPAARRVRRTANSVAKLALGIADNQALTVLCECVATVPMIIFPRVNAALARQPAWNDDLDRLRSVGVELVYGEHVWPLAEPRTAGPPELSRAATPNALKRHVWAFHGQVRRTVDRWRAAGQRPS